MTLAGYVADLEPEYAAAWAVVVPLLQGAGVKFKTIEALLHGVPTVTTSVGAEGVGGADLFAGLTDDARPSASGCRRAGDPLRLENGPAGPRSGRSASTRRPASPSRSWLTTGSGDRSRQPSVTCQSWQVPDSHLACSVVIPTYNAAATLDATLAALAAQEDVAPFEVVIADNGSVDDSAEVARRWADRLPLLRVVDASRARGVAAARNDGIRARAVTWCCCATPTT